MEVLGTLGIFGVLTFILLVVVMPISVYAAQKWAYRCYRELQELNRERRHTTAAINSLRSDFRTAADKALGEPKRKREVGSAHL